MTDASVKKVKSSDIEFQDKLVSINRVTKVTKGGRTFSFSAIVVVGNGNGVVGYGLGKAKEVQAAIQKGLDDAKKNLIKVPVYKGTIDEFINNVFGYTLEVGNSWNKKVNRYPKTIKSLITNLNKAAEASCRFYQDRFYELSTEDEIKKFNESKYADTNICTIS